MMTRTDVIDAVLGPETAAAVETLRAQKPELAAQLQDYYDAVFAPGEDSALALSPSERWLIVIRTASHTGSTSVVNWYVSQAAGAGTSDALIAKAQDVSVPWNGDPRTTAIMRHVDLIVTRPVGSGKSDIAALSDAGLSPQGIVALSQVVAFVSYQLRLIATLRALGTAT
jgi:uncharacterized protein YciW